MKNLKKVGAVALAAVMAVTFAPVASLNVFAAIPTGDQPIAASIVAAGTYAYSDDGNDNNTDVVATKSCTIDLNGQTVTGTIKAQEGAKITIIDTGATKGKVSGTITIGDATGQAAKDDTTSGALVVKGAALGTVNLVKGDITVKSGSVASIAAEDVAAAGRPAAATSSAAIDATEPLLTVMSPLTRFTVPSAAPLTTRAPEVVSSFAA